MQGLLAIDGIATQPLPWVIRELFDQDGLLRNDKGRGLRWTLENTFRQLKDGHPLPFARHLVSIVATDAVFFVRRNLRRLGL